jgi:hypothetical protein
MNLRKCLVVVVVGLGCAVAAHAQLGLYLGYTANRISGITCYDPQHACSSANGNVNPSGIQGGAYYDFKTYGPVRLGIDLRGGDFHSNKSATSSAGDKNITGMDDVLLGVRGSFHTRYSWLAPYAQVSLGYARSNAAEPINTLTSGYTGVTNPPRYEDNFFMYEGFVGVDIHVFPVLDLRPVEVGIGNMNRIGNGDGVSSVGVKTIGAGVVFHLPKVD